MPRLALIQHACPPGASQQDNLATCERLIRDAAGQGAKLAITQELFTTVYFPQIEDESLFDLAEAIPGPTSDHLARLATELGIVIVGSLFEKRAPGIYHNTAILIDGTGGTTTPAPIIARYRKMHIPHDPNFFEKYYFTPGDGPDDARRDRRGDGRGEADAHPFQPHAAAGANLAMLVCWDQWFPEPARLAALAGAQVLAYPTAIGYHHSETEPDRNAQLDAWRTVQRSHAIANGLFVAAVNRVGTENGLTFWGNSFVADPTGRVIAAGSADEEAVVIADCELDLIERQRRAWPFLRDRRIDAYAPLTRRVIDTES